ncbi:MAG: hypothetical protein WCP28_19130 [Actinomycetes bacterium]
MASGPDPNTMQLRLSSWLIWAHVDENVPMIDIAVVVTDNLPDSASPEVAVALLQLSTHGLRYTRPVLSGSRLLLATVIPAATLSVDVLLAYLLGAVTDAQAAVELIAQLGGDDDRSPATEGGYL